MVSNNDSPSIRHCVVVSNKQGDLTIKLETLLSLAITSAGHLYTVVSQEREAGERYVSTARRSYQSPLLFVYGMNQLEIC